MKRMKRFSYLLVFALLVTTLFSGTSVFAGGDFETPQNVKTDKTEYLTTDHGKLTFTMPNYSGVTNFIIAGYNAENNTVTEATEIINGALVPNSTTEYEFDVSEFCPKAGKYKFSVIAKGSTDISAEGFSAEFTVKEPSEDPKKEKQKKEKEIDNPISGITDVVAPSVRSVAVDTSYTLMGKANIRVEADYGKYKENGYDRFCYDNKFELLDGSKVIESGSSSYYYNFNNITVPYGSYKTFTIKVTPIINGTEYQAGTKTVKARSKQMKKITGVRATKISAKQAVVRWSSVDGATSYRIYKGKKMVKEVKSSVTKYTVKGKGAGSAKYKVVPVRKADGKKYAGKSATAKPKANVYITSNTGKVNSWTVKATFAVKKVSLSGKTYTVTGWGKNYAMYIKLKKFKSIKITIYCDGKIVAKKTIKNKKMNLKPQSSKKLTFKIKGKAGADLRNGFTSVYVRSTCDPATLTPR